MLSTSIENAAVDGFTRIVQAAVLPELALDTLLEKGHLTAMCWTARATNSLNRSLTAENFFNGHIADVVLHNNLAISHWTPCL
jgi:hypothetical protein